MFVFDSSTLILVTKIELLDVLLERWSLEVVIPEEVSRESCEGVQSLDALLIRRRIAESKIRVIAVKNRRVALALTRDFSLGTGEAEAIALAFQEHADLVAIDDKNGISACKLMGLRFTTAIALLVECAANQWVTGPEALTKLTALAHFGRYAAAIVNDARARLQELK